MFLARYCYLLQMGRSIPSFRQLLQIEKLDWSSFKKLLPSKKDKQMFDKVFDNVRLYTSYLWNASNPIVVESIIMGATFNNYKQLLQFNKEDAIIDEGYLREEIESLLETKTEGKTLFYRYSKKWHGFLYNSQRR